LSANSVDSDAYVDASIDNAHLADDAVGVAELSATGTASSSTFLRGDNAWVAPAGGGWGYVSTATASDSSDLSFTNMAAGYDYQYVCESIVPATDGVWFYCHLGVAGPTYRTSGYVTTSVNINNAGNSASHETTANIVIVSVSAEIIGSGTNEALYRSEITLTDPAGTSQKTSWNIYSVLYGNLPALEQSWCGGFLNLSAEAYTSLRFTISSGNIASGAILQYRRKRS